MTYNAQSFEVFSSPYSLECSAIGVAVVLALAELLKNFRKYPVELVVFNGEDYYSAPRQIKYVEQNAGRFGEILLNINIDGAGYKEGLSCFSPFNLPENINDTFYKTLHEMPEIVEGQRWYQMIIVCSSKTTVWKLPSVRSGLLKIWNVWKSRILRKTILILCVMSGLRNVCLPLHDC